MSASWLRRLKGSILSNGGPSAFRDLINSLLSDADFSFGEPWKLTDQSLSAVVPILSKCYSERGYLTLQEVSEKHVSVKDSGHIRTLDMSFKGIATPVFVRGGTVFKGNGTQSRTSSLGALFEPRAQTPVDVFCVHASHGIRSSSNFSVMRTPVPRSVEDALSSRNQARVWQSAAAPRNRSSASHCLECGSSRVFRNYEGAIICTECGQTIQQTAGAQAEGEARRQSSVMCSSHLDRMSFSDNLAANLEELSRFNKELESMISRIPADLKDQVGIAILDSQGVLGLEMFDHPDSWRAFSKSIARNYADVIASERAPVGLFELKAEKAPVAIKEFLEKAKNAKETLTLNSRISQTTALSGPATGEYTTMKQRIIHLVLKRTHIKPN